MKLGKLIFKCIVLVFVEETYDQRLVIARLADRIVVAFRGTKSSQNMRTDLKANLVS